MRLVIDFNSMFSFFRKYSPTRRLLFNPSLELYSPKFALKELSKYRKAVMSKAKISMGEFGILEKVITWKVEFVPVTEYKDFLKEAKSVCPDPDDIEYFALALKLDCGIWSNDSMLKKQPKIKVLSTSELIRELGWQPSSVSIEFKNRKLSVL